MEDSASRGCEGHECGGSVFGADIHHGDYVLQHLYAVSFQVGEELVILGDLNGPNGDLKKKH